MDDLPCREGHWTRGLVVFLAAFLLFLAINRSRLKDPPYWDAITGVYSQAIWLNHHDFNYAQLMRAPPYVYGGPRVEWSYAAALLFGALSRFAAPPKVFLICHLLVLFFSALTVTAFYHLMPEVDAWVRGLWLLAACLNPVWNGQTASIYVEVPLACFLAWSLYFFARGRYGWSAVACLAAFFMKSSALLLAATYAGGVGLLWVYQKLRPDSGPLPWRPVPILALPLTAMVLLNQSAFLRAHLSPMVDLTGNFLYFLTQCRIEFPTIALHLAFLGAGLLVIGVQAPRRRTSPALQSPSFLLQGLFVATFLASFLWFSNPLARYMTMIVFPLAYLSAQLLQPWPRVSAALAVLLLAGNVYCLEGRGFPPIPAIVGRSGNYLERSREFLTDLDGNRALCHYLEAHHFEDPIVTKWPFTQMLRLPELGYVKTALPNVIEGGMVSLVADAHRPNFLDSTQARKWLCLYAPNVFELSSGSSLKPRPGDIPVYTDPALNSPVVVYWRTPESAKAR